MSWKLYDSQGYIADIATNRGMGDVRRWVNSLNEGKPVIERYNQISGFLVTGAALITAEFLDEVWSLPVPEDQSVTKTLANLRVQLRKCDAVAIINNEIEGD